MKKLIEIVPSTRHIKPILSNKLIGLNDISFLSVGYNLVSCSKFNHLIYAEYLS